MAGNTEGLCDDSVNITGFLTAPVLMDERVDLDACHRGSIRVRLWCSQDVEWLLPLISVLAFLGVVAVQYAWDKYGPKKAEQSSAKTPKKAEAAEAKAEVAVPMAKVAEADSCAVAIQVHDEPESVQAADASAGRSQSRPATKGSAELVDIAADACTPSAKKSKSRHSLTVSEAGAGELTDVVSAASSKKCKSHVDLDVKSEAAVEFSKSKQSHATKGANVEETPAKPSPTQPAEVAEQKVTEPEKGEGPALAQDTAYSQTHEDVADTQGCQQVPAWPRTLHGLDPRCTWPPLCKGGDGACVLLRVGLHLGALVLHAVWVRAFLCISEEPEGGDHDSVCSAQKHDNLPLVCILPDPSFHYAEELWHHVCRMADFARAVLPASSLVANFHRECTPDALLVPELYGRVLVLLQATVLLSQEHHLAPDCRIDGFFLFLAVASGVDSGCGPISRWIGTRNTPSSAPTQH